MSGRLLREALLLSLCYIAVLEQTAVAQGTTVASDSCLLQTSTPSKRPAAKTRQEDTSEDGEAFVSEHAAPGTALARGGLELLSLAVEETQRAQAAARETVDAGEPLAAESQHESDQVIAEHTEATHTSKQATMSEIGSVLVKAEKAARGGVTQHAEVQRSEETLAEASTEAVRAGLMDHTEVQQSEDSAGEARTKATEVIGRIEHAAAVLATKKRSEQAMPNGPAGMNMTKMDPLTLPKDVRHVNMKTVTEDWRQEYPTTPPPAAPETPARVQESAAHCPGPRHAAALAAFVACLAPLVA